MRVCVLSNSHAAALKAAYDGLDEKHKLAMPVTFFASRQNGLASMRARDGKLVAIKDTVTADLKFTSGGIGALNPEHYDAIVIHAVGLDYQYGVFDSFYRSSAFVKDWLCAAVCKSISFRLYASLRSITEKNIFLSPRPLISEAHTVLRETVEHSSTQKYDMRDSLSSALNGLEGSFEWLPQPMETIAHGIFTRREFSDGSMRLGVDESTVGKTHNDEDFVHMNAKYGEVFWHQFMKEHGLT